MVFEKKQLSKVLAIALMIACAVAFMPLLSGQAFAASKKVTGVKASVKGTSATVSWTAFKGATKYKVKLTGAKKQTVTVSKTKKAFKNLPAGDYKVKVKAIKGKKSSWSKWVKFTVKAPIDNVSITGATIIGQTLTATAVDEAGATMAEGVTYQWYRISNFTGIVAEIPAATASTYQIAAADEDFSIFVEATFAGKTVKSAPTKAVTDVRELSSVEIVLPNGHTAPQMNDTLTLKVKDVAGDEVDLETYYGTEVDVQWYIGGKKVKDAEGVSNGKKYVIPANDTNKAYIGKAVTVTVTAAKNAKWYTGEATSLATAPIIKSTIPGGMKVEMSANAPFIGGELEAVFTPEGTSDADATYQWFRDGLKIAGATEAKYTVTKTDEGAVLSVGAKLSTDKSSSDFTYTAVAGKVVKPLTGATIEVGAKGKSGKRAAVFTTSDKAVATVTIEPAVVGASFTYEWYMDSVAVENQLFTNKFDATTENFKQTAAGADGTLDLADDQYYPYRGITKLDSLVGHTLIAVAVTDENSKVQGSVTSKATAAVKISVENVGVTIGADALSSDSEAVVGKTTLTSTLTDLPKDATVAYQWSKYDSDEEAYVAIEGATASTYAVATADIGTGVQFKLVVTGTGNYYGAPSDTETYTVVKDKGQKVNVSVTITNGKNTGITDGTAQPGDILTAVPSVASADTNKALTYTWTYKAGNEDAVTATGKEYTVPANAKAGATITLHTDSALGDYNVTGGDSKVTVKTPLTSVAIESHSTWKASTVAAGHDGVAAPNVGETLEAMPHVGTAAPAAGTVTYKWFADGKEIKDANSKTLVIAKEQFGKTITVEVSGAAGQAYEGSKVVSDATGTVGAVGAVEVYVGDLATGYPVDKDTLLKVGDKVTAKVNEYIYNAAKKEAVPVAGATITELTNVAWNVGGAEAGTGASYTFVADDEGSAWTCVAGGIDPAFEGALSYTNNIEVYPADTQPIAVSIVLSPTTTGNQITPATAAPTLKVMNGELDVTEQAVKSVKWQIYNETNGLNEWQDKVLTTFADARTAGDGQYSNQMFARNVRAIVVLKNGFASTDIGAGNVVIAHYNKVANTSGDNARWNYAAQ